LQLVDDDDLMRGALQGMMKAVGWTRSVCIGGRISEIRPAAPNRMSDRDIRHARELPFGIAGQAEC